MYKNRILNFFSNVNKILYGQNEIELFIKEILKDPIKARMNIELRRKYEYFRYKKNSLFLSDRDKILLNEIIGKKNEFHKMINQIPHLFYHSFLNNTRVYMIPENNLMSVNDAKMGDLFIFSSKQRIEAKTFNILKQKKIKSLIDQYRGNTSDNRILFSIFYKKNDILISFLDLKVQIKKDLNLVVDDIKFISSFSEIFNEYAFSKTLELYNISFSDYKCEKLSTAKYLLKEVGHLTKDFRIKRTIIKKLSDLDQKNIINSTFDFKLNKRKNNKDVLKIEDKDNSDDFSNDD